MKDDIQVFRKGADPHLIEADFSLSGEQLRKYSVWSLWLLEVTGQSGVFMGSTSWNVGEIRSFLNGGGKTQLNLSNKATHLGNTVWE